jgi:hypothetical protein
MKIMPVAKKLLAITLALMLLSALAAVSALAAPQGKKVLIKNVKEVGTLVILVDGSKWKIENPQDQRLVYNWLPFQTVLVKKNGELVNLQRGDIVDGTMIAKPTISVDAKTGRPEAGGAAADAGEGSPAMMTGGRQVVKDLEKATDRLEQVTKQLEKVVQRLEDAEFKIKAMEMRLGQLERMAGVAR